MLGWFAWNAICTAEPCSGSRFDLSKFACINVLAGWEINKGVTPSFSIFICSSSVYRVFHVLSSIILEANRAHRSKRESLGKHLSCATLFLNHRCFYVLIIIVTNWINNYVTSYWFGACGSLRFSRELFGIIFARPIRPWSYVHVLWNILYIAEDTRNRDFFF